MRTTTTPRAAGTRGRAHRDDRISNERLVQYIALLARQVAHDLGGFGAHVSSTTRAGRATRRELMQACRSLASAKQRLERERAPYIAAQMAQLALPLDARELKLQLGGGAQRLEGWVNVDLPPADLALDVRWSLPFRAGSARFVYCAHMLEHFDYPEDAVRLLSDVRRVLAPGGVLRLVVPDMEHYLRAYARGDRRFFRDRAGSWPASAELATPLAQLLSYAGASKPPNDFWGHRFGYDFETLRLLLREAGFSRVERSRFMRSRYPALRVDSASEYARARSRGKHYSLFVDAHR